MSHLVEEDLIEIRNQLIEIMISENPEQTEVLNRFT